MLKKGGTTYKMCCNSYTIHPQFGCKYPQIKTESLHLKHILIVSFQLHCGGVQSQNNENCVSVINLYGPNCITNHQWYVKGQINYSLILQILFSSVSY